MFLYVDDVRKAVVNAKEKPNAPDRATLQRRAENLLLIPYFSDDLTWFKHFMHKEVPHRKLAPFDVELNAFLRDTAVHNAPERAAYAFRIAESLAGATKRTKTEDVLRGIIGKKEDIDLQEYAMQFRFKKPENNDSPTIMFSRDHLPYGIHPCLDLHVTGRSKEGTSYVRRFIADIAKARH